MSETASWEILANRANERAERLEAELTESVKHHAVATENNVNLGNENKRLEAQRDEAVRLLHLSKCVGQNPDSNADYYCWMHGGPAEEYCPRCTFLAGLSTITPEDLAAHQRERALNAGKTEEELREQYGLAPRCGRVSVCCQSRLDTYHCDPMWCDRCGKGANSKCATHHGPWPSDTKQCPAAMAGNVTT